MPQVYRESALVAAPAYVHNQVMLKTVEAPAGQPRTRSHASKHLEAARALFAGAKRPVADFGCGIGIFTAASPRYVGLDQSPGAARATQAAGSPAVVADVHSAPLRDGSCDGVLCLNMLVEVRRPLRVLQEIDRVLAPGGSAYVKNDFLAWGHKGRLFKTLFFVGRRIAFALHALLHGREEVRVLTVAGGATAICPACFRRFFRRRGYSLRSPRRHAWILTKRS
jgi:SAM-dependent methyltransferase